MKYSNDGIGIGTGSLPEVLRVHVPLKTPAMSRTLPDVCDGSAMKCDLGLPCRTEDSRHVLETIQERMTKVLNRRRQRMRMYVTERWMRICSVYTPWILLPFWRWLVDGSCASVVMETNDFAWHPLIQSSFKWNTSSPKTRNSFHFIPFHSVSEGRGRGEGGLGLELRIDRGRQYVIVMVMNID